MILYKNATWDNVQHLLELKPQKKKKKKVAQIEAVKIHYCICLLDVLLNMSIKFSKQIANSCAKIINTKVSSKLCQASEMELFPQVVTGLTGKLKILPNIYKGRFHEKPFTIFVKNSILDV